MDVMLHLVILTFAVIGCIQLNLAGSFTGRKTGRFLGLGFHVVALALTVFTYGEMRGFFVYLALLSLTGLLYCTRKLAISQHQ